jgi:PAP2 superfamily
MPSSPGVSATASTTPSRTLQPPPGPGVFEPVFPGSTPVDVKLTQVRPLTLTSNDQFRPDGPSPLTSAEYTDDFNEVKAYGRVDSTVRTPEQTDIARFWSDNAAVQWPRAVRALALKKGLDLAETARMLTLMHVAVADSILACFDAKYHYLFWRPIHAIPRADTDGNPATEPDSTWTPLLYPNHPNHPEYPGAHGCWTTAVTASMAAFFGTDKVAFSVDSAAAVQQNTRYYQRFTDAAQEVYDARTWAGVHFRNSSMEGAWIGRKVARYIAANFMTPTKA